MLMRAIRGALRYVAHMAVMPVLAAIDGIMATLNRIKINLENI